MVKGGLKRFAVDLIHNSLSAKIVKIFEFCYLSTS